MHNVCDYLTMHEPRRRLSSWPVACRVTWRAGVACRCQL